MVEVHRARESNWESARAKPLWPGITVCHLRGRIYVSSRAYRHSQGTCIEEESIYRLSRYTAWRLLLTRSRCRWVS